MKFLSPLFLLGALAVAVPVLLHLLKRHTTRELPWSSLMFLHASPPVMRQRARLDRKILLALRCLALLLLAGAFARPFLAEPPPALQTRAGQRTLVLLDGSASMRRADLWARATGRARALAEGRAPADRLSVLVFDQQARTLLTFDDWTAAPPADRPALLERRLATLAPSPSWRGTDLDRALSTAAERLADDDAALAGQALPTATTVVLLSDLQKGARFSQSAAALGGETSLVVERVGPEEPESNAFLSPLAAGAADPAGTRVRITCAHAGPCPGLTIRSGDQQTADLAPVDLQPGESRVVTLPRVQGSPPPTTIVLAGDAHEFDNRLTVAPAVPRERHLVFVGDARPTDPRGSLFFLTRAFPTTPLLVPHIAVASPEDPGLPQAAASAQILIFDHTISGAGLAAARGVLERGHTVLVVARETTGTARLSELLGQPLTIANSPAREAVTLIDVDHQHPLLAAFSDPRFGDFSQIRFWRHRRLQGAAIERGHTLARFADGDPAWLVFGVGRGQVVVMAAGWEPAESQLALSSKFVPLLHALADSLAGDTPGRTHYGVGDEVSLPLAAPGGTADLPWNVRKPEGAVIALPTGIDRFSGTDSPGPYLATRGTQTLSFAINVAAAESETSEWPLQDFDRVAGGRLLRPGQPTSQPTPAKTAPPAQATAAFFFRVEGEQKLWRLAIAALFGLLLLETWWSGRGEPPRGRADPAPGRPAT